MKLCVTVNAFTYSDYIKMMFLFSASGTKLFANLGQRRAIRDEIQMTFDYMLICLA